MVQICFIFINFFAVNTEMLLVSEILVEADRRRYICIHEKTNDGEGRRDPLRAALGLPTAYASEVTPTSLRPFLTTYVNLCWVWGQLIAK